jgi:two-component system, chemotaxis family, chemotaxis protein CheY
MNIDEATDGAMAWDMVKKKPYGLIVSDWNMEPMSGFEFLKLVRTNEATKQLPFIMVTAESKTENIIAAKQAGVSNYIVKPFNAQTLKQKLEAVFGAF